MGPTVAVEHRQGGVVPEAAGPGLQPVGLLTDARGPGFGRLHRPQHVAALVHQRAADLLIEAVGPHHEARNGQAPAVLDPWVEGDP